MLKFNNWKFNTSFKRLISSTSVYVMPLHAVYATFPSAVRTHAVLALLEHTVEARDVTRADRGDERGEDVCEDGEAVHELVRGEVPVEDVQGDEVREDAPKGGWLARGEDREVEGDRRLALVRGDVQ
jgi:hypothetical protein